MFVGVCRFTLLVPGSHSLKEKRVLVRRAKDRVRERLGVTVAEVGGAGVLDTWQRADLAFAVVSGERDHAQRACDGVLRQVAGLDGVQLATARVEVLPFGEDWYAAASAVGDAWQEKTGAADADHSWVPREWLTDDGDGDDHE